MKKLLLAAAIAASTAGFTTAANAGVSANIGFVSDYFFRGIDQESGATASFGLDYEESGFYIGTWVADVVDGAEVDVYLGYGLEVSGVALSAGFTTYQYTGDTFDGEYNEFNLGAGYGPISLEYTVGTAEDTAGAESDYDFIGVTYEYEAFYATFGFFGDEADGSYTELGYGTEIGGFDAGVAVISNDSDLSNTVDDKGAANGDISVVFSLGKSFDL